MMNLNGSAQSSTPSDIYVKIEGITPADYGTIVKKIRQYDQFNTKQACVPAELIIFEFTGNQKAGTAYTEIIELIKEVTELSGFTLLENYSYEDFMSSCSAKRRGAQ